MALEKIMLPGENEDGEEYNTLFTFPFEGRQYVALVRTETWSDPESGVFLYRYNEWPPGEPNLDFIEDDIEYRQVAEIFDRLLADLDEDR